VVRNIPTLSCIRCDKELFPVMEEAENQPRDGTEFVSYGHYGSIFDPGDGTTIIINLCNDCLRVAASRNLVMERREKPVVIEHSYNYLQI